MKMNVKNKTVVGLLAAALLALACTAAFAQEDIRQHRECVYCGMDRKAYGYGRMLIRYQDGATVGVCSLHCVVVESNNNPGRPVASLLVADRETRHLIDAETAIWVLGGRKPGVMTKLPKWAFATKAAVETFIKANGGEIVPWSKALEAAREEVAAPPAADRKRGTGR